MNCLKCGREISGDNVFCQDCLAVMEKYPVKPTTSLQLPRREEQELPKKPAKRRKISPEERIGRQKKTIRGLSLVIAVLFVVICILAGRIAQMQIAQEREDQLGKNYTTQESQ